MHQSAEECPHCGLTLQQLDAQYEKFEWRVRRPHDTAGVLRVPQRRQLAEKIYRLERAFPQVFFSLVTVALSGEENLHSYGFWLMNRGQFESIGEDARADGGVMLVVDVNRKEVCLQFGTLLDPYVKEEEAFEALIGAHPYLLESNFPQAFDVLLVGIRKYLKKLYRIAKREARRSKQVN